MKAKIIGFDLVSFTDQQSGEVVNGSRVYYELERDNLDSAREFGNTVSSKFVRNCIPLRVGGWYEALLKPVRKEGNIVYDVGGFAELPSGK